MFEERMYVRHEYGQVTPSTGKHGKEDGHIVHVSDAKLAKKEKDLNVREFECKPRLPKPCHRFSANLSQAARTIPALLLTLPLAPSLVPWTNPLRLAPSWLLVARDPRHA
jgi:hypothetical protein